jgi:hypothetical protein
MWAAAGSPERDTEPVTISRPDQPRRDPPPPGTGTVFVVEDRRGGWSAAWHDDQNHQDWIDGTEAEVVAWALARPAAKRLIIRWGMEEYVDLADPHSGGTTDPR